MFWRFSLTIFPVTLGVEKLALNREHCSHVLGIAIGFLLIGQGYEGITCLSVCLYVH